MAHKSWINKRESFYLILILLLLIHGLSLLMRLQVSDPGKVTLPTVTKTAPMKVKILKNPPSSMKRQIVQSADGESRKEKSDAKYLSDKDRVFDRETVARKVDIFKDGAKSSGGGGGATKKGVPQKDLKLSDLGANIGDKHPMQKAAEEYTNAKNGKGQGPGVAREVSSTNDHIKDVPLGDMTHLNTTEYKYYGFYHRVRQKLEQFWGRSIQEKAEMLVKGGRRMPTSEELITSLEITLNHLGEIVAIRLLGTSGVRELDDAAVESFNEAGPFPNPPKGLVRNGQVKIEWGFVVNT